MTWRKIPNRLEFGDLVDGIAEEMGSMGEDVMWCKSALTDMLAESAARGRTPRTVCTMAHFAMARRLGCEGINPKFIDEVAARVAAGYEEMMG